MKEQPCQAEIEGPKPENANQECQTENIQERTPEPQIEKVEVEVVKILKTDNSSQTNQVKIESKEKKKVEIAESAQQTDKVE